MNLQFKSWLGTAFAIAMLTVVSGAAQAQLVVQEAFQNGYNASSWYILGNSGDVCLTSTGTIPATVSPVPTQIPACVLSSCTTSSVTGGTSMSGQCGGYGDLTHTSGYLAAGVLDPAGQGALRLTNSSGNQAGALVYAGNFPSTDGIQITFEAVSYDGNLYRGTDGGNCAGTNAAGTGVSCNGADGLSFFLADASLVTTLYNNNNPKLNGIIGAYGGSLGYSCSSSKGDGASGAYIGLGLDEYGNFLNAGDNSAVGIANTTGSHGQFQGNRIGLRGAGNVNWYQLNANFPTYYPSTLSSGYQLLAVEDTCQTGKIWNFAPAGGLVTVTWSQLHSAQSTYYPNGLTSAQQTAAVNNTSSTGTLWNYSTPSAPVNTGTMVTTSNVSGAVMNYASTGFVLTATYANLNNAYSTYYPSTLTSTQQGVALSQTETTGTLWNYSTYSSPVNTGVQIVTGTVSGSSSGGVPGEVPGAVILYDYAPVLYNNNGTTTYASTVLSSGLSTEGAGSRNETTNASNAVVSKGAMMYTYSLKITSNGLLSLSYIPYTPTAGVPGGTAGTAVQIATNWPIFGTNGTPPANFTFGFAASTGGGTNVHEIICFLAQPAEDTDTSAAANALQAAQIQEYTSVYSAFYNTHGWWGQLTSTGLYTSPTSPGNCPVGNTPGLPTGSSVGVCPTSNWDASCALTGDTSGTTLPGGNCAATGSTSDAPIAPTSRVIYTWNGSKGVPFQWANLTTAQWNALGGASASGTTLDGLGQIRLNYLRGDRSQEVTASNLTAPFRPRISVLGDIINSSPIWVGSPGEPLPSGATWADNLYSTATMPENNATYSAFQTSQQGTRENVVYVGANDGMLHGFEAGGYSATAGATNGTGSGNDGKEIVAFMPNTVINSIHSTSNSTLDYSNPNYAHNYFVDATPDAGDLYYGSAWHTWLVGGLGAGGAAIYALDVTNPQNFASTTSAASSQVMGEWTSATSGLGDLGYTYGTPQIGRFHNGKWAIVFGNGYQNTGATFNGSIFVGVLDPTSGGVTFTELTLPSTAAGVSGSPNGIISLFLEDLDGDHVVDYIYAGDLLGNVWRFDVTGNTTTAWTSATPILLFAAGAGQPIFSQVQVTAISTEGALPRVMVEFGTGSQFETPLATTLATGQQSVYGIWDGNFACWNAQTSVFYNVKVFPLQTCSSTTSGSTTTYSFTPSTVALSTLQQQSTDTADSGTITNSVTGQPENYRVISTYSVCWADQAAGTCGNTTTPTVVTYGTSTPSQYGWYYNFPVPTGTSTSGVLEQVVANPYYTLGAFNVTSYISAGTPSCSTPQGPTSWSMAFNPLTGGALTNNFFTDVTPTGFIASGVQSGSTGGSSILQLNGSIYAVSTLLQAPTGSKSVAGQTSIEKQLPPAGHGVRLNWSEIQ